MCEECSEPAEWDASLNVIFAPPWREYGVMYGPRTQGAAHREMVEFHTEHYGSVGSSATWDAHEDPAGVVRLTRRETPRKDADVFEARIGVMEGRMPKRQRQAAVYFWRSRMSVGRIATAMGVRETTVKEWIRRTRELLGTLG